MALSFDDLFGRQSGYGNRQYHTKREYAEELLDLIAEIKGDGYTLYDILDETTDLLEEK
jgi:hypothetical protein